MSPIFALDSSGKTAGVCVLDDGHILFERTLDEGLTHSETLLPLAEEAMSAASLSPADIGLYAVTAGPGSFTGLRIALSLVKGLALPYQTPAVPVSTLRALATGCGFRGIVIPALDARRNEVYWAAFDCRDGCRRLLPDAAGPVSSIAKSGILNGEPVAFVGDGAKVCYNSYNYDLVKTRPGDAGQPRLSWGTARAAAEKAAQGSALFAGALRPEYLRLSQAERERAARKAK